jgi:hypothetical protein
MIAFGKDDSLREGDEFLWNWDGSFGTDDWMNSFGIGMIGWMIKLRDRN